MSVSLDPRGIRDALKRAKAIDPITRKSFFSAMTRVTQRMRTESGRKARETYIVKSKSVTEQVALRRNPSTLSSELRWKGGAIPLLQFRTNPKSFSAKKPRALKAAVKRGGGNKPIDGAFLARMSSGHIGVFRRSARRRLPIGELFGPPLPVMLNNPEIVAHMEQVAIETMAERFDHELNRRLGGESS